MHTQIEQAVVELNGRTFGVVASEEGPGTYMLCMYVYMYVCAVYVCMYVCMYVCLVYVCAYVCMYVHCNSEMLMLPTHLLFYTQYQFRMARVRPFQVVRLPQ